MDIGDGDLVRRARTGDAAAFRLLVERHQAAARARAARWCAHPDDVDDVVQEAFLQAFAGLVRLRDPDRFGAWLADIVRNVALAAARQAPPMLLADWPEDLHPAFFRFFPAKEAAAIEAEAELWSAYLAALAGRELAGPVLGELHQALAGAAAGVERQVIGCLAGKLGLDPEDLRLQVLAGLATTAWSVSGRHWVRRGGQGGRRALIDRLDGAVRAIPASLDLSASG